MGSQNLIELEGRTYRAVLDDGIGDLLLGLWLLAIGIGSATHRGWVAAVVSVNALMIWRLLRKVVTEPRVGYVRLHPSRMAKLRRAPLIVSAIAALLLILLLLPELTGLEAGHNWLQVPSVIKAGLFLSIVAAAAGYLFELRRLYLYAALIALSIVLVVVVGAPWHWALFASGSAIAASGLFVLASFMRRYPVTPREDTPDA